MVTSLFTMGKTKQAYFEEPTGKRYKAAPKRSKYQNKRYTGKNAQVALIKKVMHQEAEAKEVLVLNSFSTAPLTATQSNLYLINGVAEGTDVGQRVGRSVTHKYIEVDLGIVCTIASGQSGNGGYGDFGFWALVLDRQPGGSLPAFAAIFDDSMTSGTGVGCDFRITTTNQDRFKILCREEWAVGACNYGASGAVAYTGACPYHIKKYVPLESLVSRDKEAKYSGTAATIGTFTYGSIYFVIAASLSTAAVNVQWLCQTKYRFTDL